MAKIIDGKALAQKVRDGIKKQNQAMQYEAGIIPGLAVILVGDDPASKVYVRNKEKACKEVGFYSRIIRKEASCTQEELITLVEELNHDDAIHGILVQSPIPSHLDEMAVVRAIDPAKDVDGFHVENVGKLMVGIPGFVPCTPKGVIRMLREEGIAMAGKHAVVVGRSNIVGKPMAMLLLAENATVTVCHSRTENLAEITRTADILVAAVGKAGLITADMVKPGAAVIDVGMNRNAEGKLCGDVDFAGVSEVAGAITPVPGGVGPMTIAMLLENTLEAAQNG